MSAAKKEESNVVPLFPAPTAAQTRAAASVASLVAPKLERERRPRSFRSNKAQIERARARAAEMRASGDWDQATGHDLVALYEWSHEQVYEVRPAELDPKGWAIAAATAARMVEQHFEGDAGKAAAFIHWVWRREYDREQWRREQRVSGQTIGWKLQFGHGSLVTQYKIDCKRLGTP